MRRECYFCHLNTVEKLLNKFDTDSESVDNLLSEINLFMQQNWRMNNPSIAQHINRIAKKHIKISDLYEKEKNSANQLLLEKYAFWESLIQKSKNPFKIAAKLAVIGNVIDYGAHTVPEKLESFIISKINEPLEIDHSDILKTSIEKAGSIVYLGDNAGEIVFDKLFIANMNHPNVTYVVRGEPVLNDVTINDANYVGIDTYCKLLPNGSDAPSTLLNICSNELIQLFESADLIISKGQGNFEGLMDCSKNNLFFLLMAKCTPIAQLIQVKKGSLVIMKNKQ